MGEGLKRRAAPSRSDSRPFCKRGWRRRAEDVQVPAGQLEQGFDGWIDDDLAFAKPWGFDLASIRVPVHIWQVELDRLVPWSHGRWLADHIPGARFTLASGQGHFSLGVDNQDQILDDLLR